MSYHPEKGSPAQVQDILVIIEEKTLKKKFILCNTEQIETNLKHNTEIDMINYKKEVEDNLEHNKKLLKRRINKIENK